MKNQQYSLGIFMSGSAPNDDSLKKNSSSLVSVELARVLLDIGLDFDQTQVLISTVSRIVSEKSPELRDDYNKLVLQKMIEYFGEKHKFIQRFHLYSQFGSLIYQPVVILLCGVTATGKSTLARRLSQRLNVENIIGSDMIREIMRDTLSVHFIPEIHYSSYKAYEHIQGPSFPLLHPVVQGYELQSKQVLVGVETAIATSFRLNETSVFEGIHLCPSVIPESLQKDPRILQFVLTLEDYEFHKSRFLKRPTRSGGKVAISSQRSLESFDHVRRIDQYLQEKAKEYNIPIIDNRSMDDTIESIIDSVWDRRKKLASPLL